MITLTSSELFRAFRDSGEKLPPKLTISGDVQFLNSGYYDKLQFVEEMTVDGELYFYNCRDIAKFPKRLTVTKNLSIYGCSSLTSLENIFVGGDFKVTGDCNKVTHIANVEVGGMMNISGCWGLREFPRTPEQQAALKKVAEVILADPNHLDMRSWHSLCGTYHCLGGWAQHISDDPTMESLHPSVAGYRILGAAAATRFFDYGKDYQILAWLREIVDAPAALR